MSDARVMTVLDDLEHLLAGLTDHPDPGLVATWHAAFKTAIAGAERGPQWPGIVARAHELGIRLEQQARHLQAIRGVVRQELEAKGRGRRALAGYMKTAH